MAITNTMLPTLMAALNAGNFGNVESRTTTKGALQLMYDEADKLFGEELKAQIRSQPASRTIQIPTLDRIANYPVLTARSCDITCTPVNSRVKTLTRTHLALDFCINASDFENNYVKFQTALGHMMKWGWEAMYKTLDAMSYTFIDSKKDTTWVPDAGGATPNANPLMLQKAGGIVFPNSKQYYAYAPSIMAQRDFTGPYVELRNTIANVEDGILANPGGGALLQSNTIKTLLNVNGVYSSNRVAPTALNPVHYLILDGSVGILNMIDLVYQGMPVINSTEFDALYGSFDNKTEFKAWGKMPDPIFPGWEWGVLQEAVCVNETIQYKVKFSADFTLDCDNLGSVTGESPIQKMEVAALTAVA